MKQNTLCGHSPLRLGCHLCQLANQATIAFAPKTPCGCGTCDDCPPADLPAWRPVPPPVIRPTADRLVITTAIGEVGDEIHRLTGPSQRAYAERVGADYVVLTDATQDPRVPCAEKWRYGDWVRAYPGGTLCVDADVFVTPGAPDIFAAVPPTHIGLRDVIDHQLHLREWSPTEMGPVCRSQGEEPPAGSDAVYWNSGVWVGRPEHADYWTPPPKPFPHLWCVEEHWCRRNAFAFGLPVYDLGRRWNWTWCEDRTFSSWESELPYFVHLAGMGNMDVPGWTQSNRLWRQAILRVLSAVFSSAGA